MESGTVTGSKKHNEEREALLRKVFDCLDTNEQESLAKVGKRPGRKGRPL